MSTIRDNLARVRDRIQAAAARAGRDPADITLVAVSKTMGTEAIEAALDAGVTDLGENRVQEARQKWPIVKGRATFHLIGHLQTNKAAAAVEMFDLVHSVDSERLARALERRAAIVDRSVPVLVEVNTSGETTKHGIEPDGVDALLEVMRECPHLPVRGLMTIGPLGGGEAGARRSFEILRALRSRLGEAGLFGTSAPQLSMGMSGDFEVAIEEGATIVRVGSAIFGPRT